MTLNEWIQSSHALETRLQLFEEEYQYSLVSRKCGSAGRVGSEPFDRLRINSVENRIETKRLYAAAAPGT